MLCLTQIIFPFFFSLKNHHLAIIIQSLVLRLSFYFLCSDFLFGQCFLSFFRVVITLFYPEAVSMLSHFSVFYKNNNKFAFMIFLLRDQNRAPRILETFVNATTSQESKYT